MGETGDDGELKGGRMLEHRQYVAWMYRDVSNAPYVKPQD